MFKNFSVKKLAALLLVGLVAIPSMVSAQVISPMPVTPYVVSFDVGVNGYPSNSNALLQNAYVNMYRVTPVIDGVYEGTLASIRSTGTEQHATFNVRPNDIVSFVGFTDLTKARNATRYTFTAPPYKNFAAVDGVRGRLCQINYLDKTTKMQSNGADSCATSMSTPASDSSVVIIPKKYPTRRYGNVEVWAQETNNPLTLVRGAEISLYDELTGAKLGSATSDRGIVTFVIETNRPFYYKATKDGKNYGGRLASATETPRVFVITSDRQHTQNYYNAEKSAVMRLGAYPNNYQGTNPVPNPDSAVAPTVSLSVSPTTIKQGQSATLTWSSTDSVYCVGSGAWGGNQLLNGSMSVNPATTTTYNLTCTGVGGSVRKSVTVTVLPAISTTPVETCEPFSANVATIRTFPGWEGYYLTGFQNYSRAFPSMAEAQQALDFAKKNNMTWACKTSVPGTKDAIEYWLNSSKTAPIGSTEKNVGEDCIDFNLANVTINQNYTLVDGNHLIATNSTLAAAKVMRSVWDKYGFNEICFVGRPDASMTYYKRLSTAPTPAEPCSSPYVMYQGVCTDPIPACKNPPANIVPSTCIDKIENGVYTERYSFSCMAGYVKSGKECVRIAVPAASDYKPTNVHFSTYENNIAVLWDAPRATLSADNGYAVFIKKGSDLTAGDLAVGITPVYVPFGTTQYTFQNLERNNKYFFKVGTGKYTNGIWVSYGNYSDFSAYTFTQPEITPIAAPTVSFSASPTNITVGQSSTLTWSSTKATYCFAWGSWGSSPADDALSGSKTVSPITTSTYNFTCTNAGGDTKKSVTITVTPATPTPISTISISASPRSIVAGQSATLSWSAVNAVNCSASNGWSGTKSASGSITVTPNFTTTYALTCYNTVTNNAYAASTTITVVQPSPTSCVKPASVTKAMFGGTSWVLTTTNKTYNVKVENVTSDGKVQFLINGDRLVGVIANGVPQSFLDFNKNGNDGTIQVYFTHYSTSGLNQSLVTFKISEKVATGSTACSTSNEIIRLMYVNNPQTYTTASGKTFNVTLERVYGGTSGNEKKVDLVINGDRMVGVPWNDNAKQHFGTAFPGADGNVTVNFINDTSTPNFAVITILAD